MYISKMKLMFIGKCMQGNLSLLLPLYLFRVSAWTPHFSGCYRPLYYRNTTSGDTENAKVTRLQPVTLVVSDNALSTAEWKYEAGETTSKPQFNLITRNRYTNDKQYSDQIIIFKKVKVKYVKAELVEPFFILFDV